MAGRTKVGRNDRCPCGSGKKCKHCCEGKARSRLGIAGWLTIAAVAAAAMVLLYFMFNMTQNERPVRRACPPGTSWQHGHCHTL